MSDYQYARVPIDAEEEYRNSLIAGFIDAESHPEAAYLPHLLANNETDSANVLSALAAHMKDCDRFDFAVAFIASSGITTLMQPLLDLQEAGVRGRILTSTYLGFNSPDALEALLRFDNIDVRVYEGALHAKGYFFQKGKLHTLVVGSSNMTQSALITNQEWNLLVHSYDTGKICDEVLQEFERLWNAPATRALTPEWLKRYRQAYRSAQSRPSYLGLPEGATDAEADLAGTAEALHDRDAITPNEMQDKALASLADIRAQGGRRALLISATGTGKTYLAAFDVKAARAKRVLFVVHRERIAADALASFRRVNGDGRTYGLYSGARHDAQADYVFCTIQLLARHLDDFNPQAFDYVIIDEAHRAGAPSYQAVLAHFQPRFLLGMTATPDRTDGYDIYKLFDNNIAYRITLQDAQKSEMLAPFHYFGISDLRVDGREIDELSSFSQLVSSQRVEHILDRIRAYSVEHERRGLIFCSRVEEAEQLAIEFRARGIRALALSGSTSDSERDRAIERLECNRAEHPHDYLEYLITVDIFNEGIDIPSLNQIIMLRPTESAIIFVQQLGRGLRLHEGKEYTLVLDFIGNYQKSFLIPIALSGDRTYNKDNLRRYVREGNRIIPGCSTINFDSIVEEKIYRALDAATFSAARLIKQEYAALKHMLGRIPSLQDFYENGAIDPLLIFSSASYGSYHAFLKKAEPDYTVRFTAVQEQMLTFVSKKLASGKRPQELLLLQRLLDYPALTEGEYRTAVRQVSGRLPIAACSVARVLGAQFLTGAQATTFHDCRFVDFEGGVFHVATPFAQALRDGEFLRQMREVVAFGLRLFADKYAHPYEDTNLVLYEKYTYEDVCRLLNWSMNVNAQNIGGYKYDAETNTFPVFINYEKPEDVSATTNYQDRFVSPRELIAISKQSRTLDSPEIVRLRESETNGLRTYLFMRKNKDDRESKEFYFLGRMRPTGRFTPFTMAGTDASAVEIEYVLDVPVKAELYDYLTAVIG